MRKVSLDIKRKFGLHKIREKTGNVRGSPTLPMHGGDL